MRFKPAFAIVGAVLILAAAAAIGTTLAQQPRLSPSAAASPGDRTLGMAIMSASVNPDGTLAGGYGAGVVGALRWGAGSYDVAFNRSVEGCTYVASLAGPSAVHTGFISATGQIFYLNGTSYYGLRVHTWDAKQADADRTFQVIVLCAR